MFKSLPRYEFVALGAMSKITEFTLVAGSLFVPYNRALISNVSSKCCVRGGDERTAIKWEASNRPGKEQGASVGERGVSFCLLIGREKVLAQNSMHPLACSCLLAGHDGIPALVVKWNFELQLLCLGYLPQTTIKLNGC